MRSYGGLWARIVSEANLYAAWRRVRRNHSQSDEVLAFESDLEDNLRVLRDELTSGTYCPSGYRMFKIWDPKPRTISCAPIRDRVVHHALCCVIAPVLERSFSDASYACRVGFGSHRACRRVQELARRSTHFVKLDVRHYFDSISRERLLEVVLPRFREAPVRNLIGCIVGEGTGLPIGNLTSQWLANTFLNELDHLLEERDVRHVRYMDDFVVFCKSKASCWAVRDNIANYLLNRRGLSLKDEATIVAPVSEGIPFLGLRIWPRQWRFAHARLWRSRRKMRQRERECLSGRRTAGQLVASVRSICGAASWFGFKGIFNSKSESVILATEDKAASGSNRSNRGGSWNNNAQNCRSAYRNNNYNPSNANNNLGFRLSSTPRDLTAQTSHSVRPVSEEIVGTKSASPMTTGKRTEFRPKPLLATLHCPGASDETVNICEMDNRGSDV